jgi:hypothetical protein
MNLDLASNSGDRLRHSSRFTLSDVLALLYQKSDRGPDRPPSPVPVQDLVRIGCAPETLLWLVQRGFAEYRDPQAEGTSAGRPHGETGSPIPPVACLALTVQGLIAARTRSASSSPDETQTGRRGEPDPPDRAIPVWDGRTSELCYRGELVLRLRHPGSRQWALLTAFQAQGWPQRLPDPLPPDSPGGDPRQSLCDAIKNLNRNRKNHLLRFFRADGGRAIGWQAID